MTEEEFWWEYYMHPSRPYDGRVIQQVKGRAECEMKKYKWKEPKMTNAEWMVKKKISFKQIEVKRENAIGLYCITASEGVTARCTGKSSAHALINWLDMEHKEPVLDESEKKYLSAVVKPFKDQVKYIAKRQNGCEKVDRLEIKTKAIKGGYDYMYLPSFEEGTMYKGMKYGKLYTLEELGL